MISCHTGVCESNTHYTCYQCRQQFRLRLRAWTCQHYACAKLVSNFDLKVVWPLAMSKAGRGGEQGNTISFALQEKYMGPCKALKGTHTHTHTHSKVTSATKCHFLCLPDLRKQQFPLPCLRGGNDTVDWDNVGSNWSIGNCLSNFGKRYNSKRSLWEIEARWGFPTLSSPFRNMPDLPWAVELCMLFASCERPCLFASTISSAREMGSNGYSSKGGAVGGGCSGWG